jgi:1-acyl-sn-glycerol-3-phosphate acyltransferase
MADASALDEAIRTIRGGAVAGILPEGRVNPDPFGPLQRGHSGAARVALAADAPIVPAGIWGTQHRWPRDGLTWRRPWRPTVVVAFGAPIRPEGSSRSFAEARQLTARLMRAIADQVEVARAMA